MRLLLSGLIPVHYWIHPNNAPPLILFSIMGCQ